MKFPSLSVPAISLLTTGLGLAPVIAADSAPADGWDAVAKEWKCPEWFKDAKLGMWIHWGPQTIPAKGGGWYARHLYMEPKELGGEQWGKEAWQFHRDTYGHQSEFGFKDLCHLWKAEKLDTEKVVKQFKAWGARYVATMANHHDNFDLFPSTIHGWNTTKVGPMRDLVGEFAEAAKKNGLPWAATVHVSRAKSWMKPAFGSDSEGPKKDVPYDGHLTKADGKGKWWEGLDPQQLYASNYPDFEKEVTQRHLELFGNYRPDLVYFDDANVPDAMKPACALLYNESRQRSGAIEAIVTVKHPEQGTLLDYEKGVAEDMMPDYWQSDTTLAEDWFLKPNADGSSAMRHDARSLKELLLDVISKRGVLLLNIAFRADGTIPEDQAAVMEEFGAWVAANGEAIYGSRPWKVYGEGGKTEGGHFKERIQSSPAWGPDVLRFTTDKAGRVLYVSVFGDPAGKEVLVKSLSPAEKLFAGKITDVSLIGSDEKIGWSLKEDGLHVKMPGRLAFKDANILKLETTGL